MIRFLIIGLLRDKSRSRLPVIVVTIGVFLTVLMHSYITGFMGDSIEMNARFSHGHVKVMSRSYALEMDQLPNDLALLQVGALKQELEILFPDVHWAARIQFGGLVDAPDSLGETRAQGPVLGIGLDLLSPESLEIQRLNLDQSVVRGRLPVERGEALLSDEFASRIGVVPGDEVTLIGSGMNASMVMYNFTISGTLGFGVEIMDKGTLVADIQDVRMALDMEDAAGEILGFLATGFYDDHKTREMAAGFNKLYENDPDSFAPVMKSLSQQGSMGQYVQLSNVWAWYISLVFILAMSIVLWNAGLLGALRRYGEVGIRLAMGEEKGHIYRSMIVESIAIGIAGTVAGTLLGLGVSWLIQVYGIDISGMMEGATVMMPSVIRTRITPVDYYIGFVPGLISTVTGTMLAGIGIYKRQTARLFKELEA